MQKLNSSKMIIRDVKNYDSTDIFEWRNDPLSRLMFKDGHLISFEEHQNWFRVSLADPMTAIYVGLLQEKKVGVCRFDYIVSKNYSEVGININPAMRGKGLSYPLLLLAIKKYRIRNIHSLNATIKKENIASIKIFKLCGFNLEKEDASFYYFVKN